MDDEVIVIPSSPPVSDEVIAISSSPPVPDQTNSPEEAPDEQCKSSAADDAPPADTASPIDSAYATKAPGTARNSSEVAEVPEESMVVDGAEDEAMVIPAVTSKKRKRDDVKDVEAEAEAETEPRAKGRSFSHILPPGSVNPMSVYGQRPAPKKPEQLIVSMLLAQESKNGVDNDDKTYYEYRLEDFSFYTGRSHIKPKEGARDPYPFKYPWEMIRLSAMNIVPNIEYLYADGFLVGEDGVRHYFERMKVDVLSVSYRDPFKPRDIHVQSSMCSNSRSGDTRLRDVWYRLGTPSKEYKPYYEPFQWLAQFGLHFFAFVESQMRKGDVLLRDFRNFGDWMERQFDKRGDKVEVETFFFGWWNAVGSRRDFRNDITTHKDWLWNQVYAVHAYRRFADLTLWKETRTLNAIAPAYPGRHENLTVVTPYVYEIFKDMYGPHLKKVVPVPDVPKKLAGVLVHKKQKAKTNEVYVPRVGDCVQVAVEEKGTWSKKEKTKRRKGVKGVVVDDDEKEEEEWFGYVTKLEGRQIKIVWLYRPKDTILDGGHYPYKNELFFSDHCNCDEDSDPLYAKNIVRKISVVFNPKTTEEMESAEYFIRQKAQATDCAFISLSKKDLELGNCQCTDPDDDDTILPNLYHKLKKQFPVGSTVLYTPEGKDVKLLEPGVVFALDDSTMGITLRKLVRAPGVVPGAKPNQLLWTQETAYLHCGIIGNIKRRCYIAVLRDDARPETPYDRDGIGELFYISGALDSEGNTIPVPELGQDEFREGWSLTDELPKDKPVLRGMDLFCGGGNFGRGLEEGGVVQMKWAVDFDKNPLHSYRANLNNLDDTKLYLGSINNYLEDAICGRYSEKTGIPGKDEVDFISAGSPCQGFSLANNCRTSFGAQRKQSLVCSLATAIDVYRPTYAILENVHGIATSRIRNGKQENTYTEMLCAIVGMGYQIQSFFCDAWSHGNPQSRTRLILAISKTGYKALDRPPRSHQHSPNAKSQALYSAPNGARFGRREIGELTPFPYLTTEVAWAHLPNIGNGHVGLSIRYPDHTCAGANDTTIRLLMSHVPRFMANNSWRVAIDSGRLHPVLQTFNQVGEKGTAVSRTYSRVFRSGLCRTITTTPTPQCSRTGRWMHSDENRLLTIQEARIAQGYPEDDVLAGAPSNKLHVIGNSVARGVSLALGIAVREAYLESFMDEVHGAINNATDCDKTDGVLELELAIGAVEPVDVDAAAAAEQALQADAQNDMDKCVLPSISSDTDPMDLDPDDAVAEHTQPAENEDQVPADDAVAEDIQPAENEEQLPADDATAGDVQHAENEDQIVADEVNGHNAAPGDDSTILSAENEEQQPADEVNGHNSVSRDDSTMPAEEANDHNSVSGDGSTLFVDEANGHTTASGDDNTMLTNDAPTNHVQPSENSDQLPTYEAIPHTAPSASGDDSILSLRNDADESMWAGEPSEDTFFGRKEYGGGDDDELDLLDADGEDDEEFSI
ncbi:hypothetical protein BZA05DRAFT_416835 [Tricharina praecox]|uniref:uncharacterized protein n=1 Tax=Tricharina praecox TaxID=43433 RepID=UPI002220635F|nr:uncharacterized protein BZA05DRAFT_416835 [Tricharina praecox]KAI5855238.1 hypothetical protein BZA05DRAFT_416835 [Tricharina praecox]